MLKNYSNGKCNEIETLNIHELNNLQVDFDKYQYIAFTPKKK